MTSPVLAQEQPDGSRLYVHPITGEKVPSVTSVLKMIAKPRLDMWMAGLCARYAAENWEELSQMQDWQRIELIKGAPAEQREMARVLGNEVHEAIDSFAVGRPAEVTKASSSYLDRFIDFMLTQRPRVIESEVTVWSRRYQYAGTADWIMEFSGGLIVLGDNKTGKNVHGDAALQLAALACADFIIREDGTEEPMPAIGRRYVLHLRPRSWKLYEPRNYADCFSAFLAAREIMRWQHEIEPEIMRRVA